MTSTEEDWTGGYKDFNVEMDIEVNHSRDAVNVKRLMSSILERSLLDLTGNDARFFQEALDWITDDYLADNEIPPLFSFDNICESLDIDPSNMRRGILRLPRKI